jgi:hypothetical protein
MGGILLKKILVISLSIVLLLIIGYFACRYVSTQMKIYYDNKIAQNINENSKIPYDLLTKYNGVNQDKLKEDYKYTDNYMSNDYSSEDIFLKFSGYPNDESEYYLNGIVIKNNKYNLLEITSGTDVLEVEKIFKMHDFYKESKNKYKNHDVTILLEVDNNKVEQISVEIKTKYLGNRLY